MLFKINKIRLIALLIFFVPLLILPWKGFFLLNDSYVYYWNVQNFFSNGFILHPLTSPTSLFPTFLGSLLMYIWNSPSVLRLLSYSFSFFTGVFFYKILVFLQIPRKLAFLLFVILFFNPIFFNLSLTFMTEPYFFLPLLISWYLFFKYLDKNKKMNLYFSILFLTLSFMSRQLAIFTFFAYLVVFVLYKKEKKDIYAFLFFLIAFFWYQFIYHKPLAYTQGSLIKTLTLLQNPLYIKEFIYRFFYVFYYIGLFSTPLTLTYIIGVFISKEFSKKFIYWLSGFFLFFFFMSLFFWFKEKSLMFYVPNILSYAGFLPQSLSFGIKQTFFVNSPVRIRALFTMVSIFSISIYLSVLKNNLNTLKKYKKFNKYICTLFLASIFMIIPTTLFRDFFDRYLLILVPFTLLIFVLYTKDTLLKYFYVLFFLSFVFAAWSIVLEYDYLSLNKFAWEYPEKNNYSYKEFRSTFEYNLYPLLDKISNTESPEVLNRNYWEPPLRSYKYYLSYTDVINYCPLKDDLYYTTPLNFGFKSPLKILIKCTNALN